MMTADHLDLWPMLPKIPEEYILIRVLEAAVEAHSSTWHPRADFVFKLLHCAEMKLAQESYGVSRKTKILPLKGAK